MPVAHDLDELGALQAHPEAHWCNHMSARQTTINNIAYVLHPLRVNFARWTCSFLVLTGLQGLPMTTQSGGKLRGSGSKQTRAREPHLKFCLQLCHGTPHLFRPLVLCLTTSMSATTDLWHGKPKHPSATAYTPSWRGFDGPLEAWQQVRLGSPASTQTSAIASFAGQRLAFA